LYLGIGGVIDGGSGFVHEDYSGKFQEGAGETHELALTLGQVASTFSHFRVETEEDI